MTTIVYDSIHKIGENDFTLIDDEWEINGDQTNHCTFDEWFSDYMLGDDKICV